MSRTEKSHTFYGIYIEQESTYEPSEWETDDIVAGLLKIPGCVEARKHETKPTTVISVHEVSPLEKCSIGGTALTGPSTIDHIAIQLPTLKGNQRYVLRGLEE